jgi:hypothetical protein
MTLGRTPMTSNGFSIPLPRAIDDENLHPSSSSTPQPQQFEFSPTSFFIEAIKLSEITDRMLRALYNKSITGIKSNIVNRDQGEDDYTATLDVVTNLEAACNKFYINLPAELRWAKGETTTLDPPTGQSAEPTINPTYLERQRNVLHARYAYPIPSWPVP